MDWDAWSWSWHFKKGPGVLIGQAQPAAGAACQTGELPRIEINGGAGPAPGSSWNSGAYGGYVHYGGTLGPAGPCATVSGAIPCATYASAGRVPFATAPTLAVPVRTGSVAAPAATVAPGSASAVPISTTNGLPGEAAQIMTMSLELSRVRMRETGYLEAVAF